MSKIDDDGRGARASEAPPLPLSARRAGTFTSGACYAAAVPDARISGMSSISVIVRARDAARDIGRCLQLIRDQEVGTREIELIVVDNGSSDGTAEIARGFGAQVIELPAAEFTFGRALNLGAAHARGEVLVALSVDAFARDRAWLARLAQALSDPRVACASGDRFRPDGAPLTARVEQDAALLAADPEWGYSNGAGAFRAALWRERPFRADLPGCEDREWSRYWLERGHTCVIDPALVVEHDHTHDPLRAIYVRARREAEGFAAFLDYPPYGVRELVAKWWSDLRFYDSAWRARLSHRRAARLLGEFAGRRRGRR
jgi:glycosyltransferase involved in cell wall biosynthesis